MGSAEVVTMCINVELKQDNFGANTFHTRWMLEKSEINQDWTTVSMIAERITG